MPGNRSDLGRVAPKKVNGKNREICEIFVIWRDFWDPRPAVHDAQPMKFRATQKSSTVEGHRKNFAARRKFPDHFFEGSTIRKLMGRVRTIDVGGLGKLQHAPKFLRGRPL